MEWSDPMTEFFDAHRPATAFDHDSTLVVAMELSGKSWQLGAVIRLGSDQERREIQTSPERKRARGRSSARPEGPGRRTPPPRRSVACVPGPDLTHPNRCA